MTYRTAKDIILRRLRSFTDKNNRYRQEQDIDIDYNNLESAELYDNSNFDDLKLYIMAANANSSFAESIFSANVTSVFGGNKRPSLVELRQKRKEIVQKLDKVEIEHAQWKGKPRTEGNVDDRREVDTDVAEIIDDLRNWRDETKQVLEESKKLRSNRGW